MRHLILMTFMLCSLGVSAEITKDDSVRAFKDPLYFQLYLGINKSGNENLPWTEFSKYPWSGGAFFGIGREFSKLWGWRAALRFNHNKSRNVQECESPDVYGWNNVGLFGDITFDFSDVFRKKSSLRLDSMGRVKSPRFNLKVFAGVGAAYTWNFDNVPLSYSHAYSRSSKLLPAVRAGLTATWRLTNRWRIGAELSQTLFEDHFNGVAYDTPLDTRSNLKVGLTYMLAEKKRVQTKPVIRRNRLKYCPPLPLILPDPEDIKLRQIQGHAFLDFPVNETIIYPKYRKNPEELARIYKSVDSASFDKSVVIQRITLHGYASPESPYSNNIRLAKGRTEELRNHLKRKYGFDSQIFVTDYTPEDWGNLRSFLMNTDERKIKDNFWYDNPAYVETPEVPEYVLTYREELIEIIDREMDSDAKEELLKRVGDGKPYKWLLNHVYPGLRHTDYIIDYEVKAYPVAKGRRLIYTHPEALSLEEMYYVAQSYEEGSDNWMDALLIAAKQYPDSNIANYNAACGCIMTRRLVDAKNYLAKAGDNEDTRYLSDVIRAMEGLVNWHIINDKVIITE